MSLSFYMDHHVPRVITVGLRLRGVDVLTAYEDGASELDDPALLNRGVVYAHQLRVSIGTCLEDLEIIAKVGTTEELMNAVIFLPLSK